MSKLDRVRDAQRAVQRAAIARYLGRANVRWQNRAAFRAQEGGADSPQRNARFRAREAGLSRLRVLSKAGMLPVGIERKMGATLDYTPFAPSETARKAGRPVARLVEMRGAGVQPEGFATGFLIAPGLLMTNHHVLPSAADAVDVGANFLFERSERGVEQGIIFPLDPDAFYLSHEVLDFAVVAVGNRSHDGLALEDLGVITLIEATPKILKGQPVNIIQFPDGGPKQYAVTQNRLVDILEKEGFLHYETDTDPGSSGSPAFSQSWELVALHHASIPEMRDGRPVAIGGEFWIEEMGDDAVHWVANEGVRVSVMVNALTEALKTLKDERRQTMLRELLATTTDPVDDMAKVAVPAALPLPGETLTGPGPGTTPAAVRNQVVINGPVTIHVYAPGAPAVAAAPEPVVKAVVAVSALEKVIRFDPDYKNRKGYDPKFLDPKIRVPTPRVVEERLDELLKNSAGNPRVLKYHHFELVMNEVRRLQMWSAVNVDYDPAKKSTRNREEFGTDKWIPDKRIAAELQIFDADFYKPAGNIDRGHMVRREDNAWGNSELEIEFANADTFHWTNCTPQHEAFNQSAPGRNDKIYKGMTGLWGDFENYVQQSRTGTDTKACILAGPVLDNDNDPSADFGLGEIQYPLKYWKVICVADPDEDGKPQLKAFGFMLSQSDVVERFGIERFEPGRFAKHHKSLKTITKQTGVVFDEVLHAADVKQ